MMFLYNLEIYEWIYLERYDINYVSTKVLATKLMIPLGNESPPAVVSIQLCLKKANNS